MCVFSLLKLNSCNFEAFFKKLSGFFFNVTIVKSINIFWKGANYSKPRTFDSYQNHYQGNVYVYFLIKTD